MPQTGSSQHVRLFAVYERGTLAVNDEPIVVEKYKVNYVKLPRAEEINNLNTMNDCQQFVKERSGVAV
jgi:hypothetical protein